MFSLFLFLLQERMIKHISKYNKEPQHEKMYNLLREKGNELILPKIFPHDKTKPLEKSVSPNKASHEQEKVGRLLKRGDRG